MRNQMLRWDGGDLYWSELRPYEGGRIVVCRRGADGTTSDVTPPGFNARTRVHEYGGGHYAVKDGTVYFTNYSDQRLYRQDRDGAPQPITPAKDIRHSDMLVDARRERVFAVREDHTTGAAEAVNTIVAIDVPSGMDADTGAGADAAVRAAATVTLVAPKAGLARASNAGRVFLADIGMPLALFGAEREMLAALYGLGDLVELVPSS